MSEYVYVRLKKDGTWHLTRSDWMTLCGYEGQWQPAWEAKWAERSKDPQEPLCKRCIKCREARER